MENKIPKEIQEKIGELQLLQQRLNLFANQKQIFQLQKIELENALRELKGAKAPVYKLVGEILIEKSPDTLKKELEEKNNDVDIRIKSLEKQEKSSKDKAMDLQKEVAKKLK